MICSRCGVDQERDQFGPSADYWARQRECKTCGRFRAQHRKHGLDELQRATVARHQGGCAICGHPEPSSRGWVVDHDHTCCSGEASCPKCRRGIVCSWCNSMLGYAFDRIETLKAAIAYLEAPRTCAWHMPIACAPSICGNAVPNADATNGQDGRTYSDELN